MSGWDVSDADMPNIPGSQRADVPELPDGALDALLTGDLVTDEACAGLQPAAALSPRSTRRRRVANWPGTRGP